MKCSWTTHACACVMMLLAVSASADAGSLTLEWDANTESDLAGYVVYYGTSSGTYSASIDVGNQTSAVVAELVEGQQYYFAVLAYNAAGLTSDVSGEVSGIAPGGPTTGLVASYGFEETDGATVIDGSGAGHDGTIAGAARTANGKYGRALQFDGVDDFVTIADDAALDLTTGMTLEAWVNPEALDGWRSIVLKERPGGLAYALYANDSVPNPAATVNVGGDVSASGTAPLPLNTWTHVAATYDGADLRLYVNGAIVGTRPLSGPMTTSADPLRIGGNAIWGEYFSGRIDEVRIYNRAVDAAEIADHMYVAAETGLVAAFGFEESGGTQAADASGTGNDGTIAGATWTASGKYGSALSFDGTNDVVTVADAASLDTPEVTVEAWVFPTALSGWRTAVLKESPTGMVYGLYANDNLPRAAFTVNVDGPDVSATSDGPLPLDTWSHLAATYDGATIRIYVNGTQVGVTTRTGSLGATAEPLRIGGNAVWGEYFSGRIDEVRVYRRALSAEEIQHDMTRPVVPSP